MDITSQKIRFLQMDNENRDTYYKAIKCFL